MTIPSEALAMIDAQGEIIAVMDIQAKCLTSIIEKLNTACNRMVAEYPEGETFISDLSVVDETADFQGAQERLHAAVARMERIVEEMPDA